MTPRGHAIIKPAISLRGQGATEYLVLLAVVLVIALVSIALLGFFPGTAADSQIAESQIYWKGASPIAITESSSTSYRATTDAISFLYIRIRNNAAYPIRITKVIGENGEYVSQVYDSAIGNVRNITDAYYLGPGEETYFAWNGWWGVPNDRRIYVSRSGLGTSVGYQLFGASALCSSSAQYGTLTFKEFGFEYVAYIEGQAITKRQLGKRLLIKCEPPYTGG